jgi:hypothetical protein
MQVISIIDIGIIDELDIKMFKQLESDSDNYLQHTDDGNIRRVS